MKKRMGLALFVTSFTIFAAAYVPVMADNVDAKQIFFIEDGVSTLYTTSAHTVSEFLAERGIQMTPRDTLSMEYTDPLETGAKIELKRGFNVNVSVDGSADQFKVSQGTAIGTFLRLYESEKKQDYYYTGSLVDILKPNQTVFLSSYRAETVTEETEIPFDTQTVDNAELAKGKENVAQEGQPGKKATTYKVLYLGDEEQSREIVSEEVETAPVPKIVEEGTADKPAPAPKPSAGSGGAADFSYSQVYSMVATAYTAGPESTGKSPGMPGYGITASGMRAKPGVVSVDPRVIPLGTHLYVEGYGYAIAADTGSAIKGKRIDVFVETLSEAYRWGRRTVEVYVLD